MSIPVTVITPVFNAEATLGRCIESVQSQNVDTQHIIVDGLSTDASLSVAGHYKRKSDLIISESDKGIYDAINKGISYSEGKIIAILNSDDYYLHQDTLQRVIEHFDEGVQIVYGGTRYFTQGDDKYVDYLPSEYFGAGSFSAGWCPPHPSFFVLRSCYEEGGVFDISLKVAADFDIMLRFFEFNMFRSVRMDKVVVGMSAGGYSSKLTSIYKGMNEIKTSFRKQGLKVPKGYFLKRYTRKFIERKMSLLRG